MMWPWKVKVLKYAAFRPTPTDLFEVWNRIYIWPIQALITKLCHLGILAFAATVIVISKDVTKLFPQSSGIHLRTVICVPFRSSNNSQRGTSGQHGKVKVFITEAAIANGANWSQGSNHMKCHVDEEVNRIKIVFLHLFEAIGLFPTTKISNGNANSVSHGRVKYRIPLRICFLTIRFELLRQIDSKKQHEGCVKYPPQEVQASSASSHTAQSYK